jgi:hypothetical protein
MIRELEELRIVEERITARLVILRLDEASFRNVEESIQLIGLSIFVTGVLMMDNKLGEYAGPMFVFNKDLLRAYNRYESKHIGDQAKRIRYLLEFVKRFRKKFRPA